MAETRTSTSLVIHRSRDIGPGCFLPGSKFLAVPISDSSLPDTIINKIRFTKPCRIKQIAPIENDVLLH